MFFKYLGLRRTFRRRAGLSDQALLNRLKIAPEDAWIAVAIRNALATCCRIPATAIYPEDEFETLSRMIVSGWDKLFFVTALENETSKRIDMDRLELLAVSKHWPATRKAKGVEPFGKWLMQSIPPIKQVCGAQLEGRVRTPGATRRA